MILIFREVRKCASPEIMGILTKAREFLKTTVADSTREIYSRDWKSFACWCSDHRLTNLPSTPDVVICYLTSIAMNGLQIPTIRRRSAAIASMHRAAGYPSPTSHPAVKELLRGMTRKLGTPPKPVDELLSEDIKKMVAALPDTLIGKRDKALILLGFAGAFRRSELVELNVEDIQYRNEGIVILLRHNKTDQLNKGRYVGIPYGANPETCPVQNFKLWLGESGIVDGAIFRGINRHGQIASNRLSRRSVGDIVKHAAKAAGLDAARYSGHSLRSGHCTQASRAGVPEHIIMQQTGHKSKENFAKYVRLGRIFEENSAKGIGL